MKRPLNILILLAGISAFLSAQDTIKPFQDSLTQKAYILEAIERDGETLPEVSLDDINVVRKMGLKERFKWWKHKKLVRNVKKVYPYALLVRDMLEDVKDTIKTMPDVRTRRKYLKSYEKEMFKKYEGDLRDMTMSQGRLFIKLIDRETQNTGYNLIKEHRGGVPAIFWQGIARLFGSNLKDQYDPMGNDYLIEKVIYEIEAGIIKI